MSSHTITPGRSQGAPAALRRLLAFDTAGSACSAAVWQDGELRASRFEAMQRGQSERLVPMIEEVMNEARLTYGALDTIAVTLGPGGFTGVRIGLATARGLALACRRPVIGISNFEAVGAAVPAVDRRARHLVVLIDAKRRDLFVQAFGAGLQPLCKPLSAKPEDLDRVLPGGPLCLAGNAVNQAGSALEAAGRDLVYARSCGEAEAASFADLAASRGLPDPPALPPRPIYLRAPDVTVPKRTAQPPREPA